MHKSIVAIVETLRAPFYHLIVGMLGALIILLLKAWIIPAQPRIATVDLTGIVHEYTLSIAKNTKSLSQMQSTMQLFSQSMGRALQSVAKEHHVVLVPRQAVVSGAVDYTDVIVNRVKQQLRHKQAPTIKDRKADYFGRW